VSEGDEAAAGAAAAARSAVLVTGGSGYLGSLVLRTLADAGVGPLVSVDVRAVARTDAGVTYLEADLRDHDLTGTLREHEVGAVVHLAAIVDPPAGDGRRHPARHRGRRDPPDHRRLPRRGRLPPHRHLVRGRLRLRPGQPRPVAGRVRPDPGPPRFAYSRHKAEVERLVEQVRRDHPELGVLLLRPGTVLGETTDNQITALFSGPVVLGLRDTDVPFVFVLDADVAEVIRRGVASGSPARSTSPATAC
jgi:UDP-glucose 4-epimerase